MKAAQQAKAAAVADDRFEEAIEFRNAAKQAQARIDELEKQASGAGEIVPLPLSPHRTLTTLACTSAQAEPQLAAAAVKDLQANASDVAKAAVREVRLWST